MNYFDYKDKNKCCYLIVNENNGNILQVNTKNSVHPDEDLATWRMIFPHNNIIDTLLGEWTWEATTGGIGGGTYDTEFKSVIKIVSQNEDASINYEVYVEDTLFSQGSFQILYNWESGYNKRAYIELPHYNRIAPWCISFGYIGEPLDKDTLCFWDMNIDGLIYYYQRKK